MGCAGSKHRNRCRNCKGRLSPVVVPRSYSMHVHHPAQHTGDSYHTVALTSSTIGSLSLCESSFMPIQKQLDDMDEKKLISSHRFHQVDEQKDIEVRDYKEKMNSDLQAKLMEAKVWSSMMNERIPKIVPKTPIMTPPGEPETINTWELMEGLEDVSPLRSSPNHLRSFSFDVVRSHDVDDDCAAPFDRPKSRFHDNVKSINRVDDLDPPEIVSSFRKSLKELPSEHPFLMRIPDMKTNLQEEKEEEGNCKRKTFGKEKVIVYFTSLRGIRETYENCCNVRIILKSLGIRIDERDVSMHSGFKDELKKKLEDKFNNGVGIALPRVFLGNKYVGGVEEIKKLNENGTLEKLMKNCERVEDGLTGLSNECEACGDVRFLPCETCSGSCKIYNEGEEEEEEEKTEYGFQRCTDCNENGLIRCPLCC